MLEYIKCNLCDADDYTYLNYEGGNRVVRCNRCGLIYRNPRSNVSVDREKESVRLYGDYEKTEEQISFARDAIFQNVLTSLRKLFKQEKKALLDIGCGQGYFLNLAKQEGWQVWGVEPVSSACDYAKKKYTIDVLNSGIEGANFNDDSFDVVTLWNVFDHLPDPRNTGREIFRILKPGGIAIIRVPNVDFHILAHKFFLLANLILKGGIMQDPSIIVNYGFGRKTVRSMLQNAGFFHVSVVNSPLSKGDPYNILKFKKIHHFVFAAVKLWLQGLSWLIFLLSFGKICSSSAILVTAKKK
jgi:2-polyprenyl-3-methyl-5-hydroxy-6-metoxy-1,4-benzoquinol methylase